MTTPSSTERDWNEVVPYASCVTEPDVVARAVSEYENLNPASLRGLASHWADLEREALQAHLDDGRTANELYAEGMPRPEWDRWTAYRRARLLAGVCRSLYELKQEVGNYNLDELPTSEKFLRRACKALEAVQELPDAQKSLDTLYREVSESEDVKPDTIGRMFRRHQDGRKYSSLDDLLPILEFAERVAGLMDSGHRDVHN